jgi:chemotaxis protein methyltransferase CheR
MTAATISQDDFLKFQEYFYRKTGIRFEDTKRYFVDKRLLERIGHTGSANFREYFSRLRFEADGTELQALVNLMTVNETYFFPRGLPVRLPGELDTARIVARKKDKSPIRIWALPSSSGEEAYTIAMCLIERWPGIKDHDVEIISSDIDTNILAQAKAGLYSARSTCMCRKATCASTSRRPPADFRSTTRCAMPSSSRA